MADVHFRVAEAAPGVVVGIAVPDAEARHARPPVRRVTLIRDARDFARLGSQWRQLEISTDAHRSVFQGFDWLQAWLAVNAGPDSSPPLCVALGYRDNQLVFAWPLMMTRAGPFSVLRWMSEPFSQYGDILLARDECAKAWMGDAIATIRALPGIDSIRLRHVRDDAAASAYLRQSFRNARFPGQAPWLDLTAFADEAAYEARYSSSQRKRRRKIRKNLEDDLGPVAFRVLPPGGETEAAIDRAIAQKSQWIETRGRQNRVLGCPVIGDFLKQLSRSSGSSSMQLVVSELSAGGKPVSWEIGLRTGGVHYGFITSHVTALTDYSPARLHMDLSQRQALKDGMLAFDLMLPHDAYKDSWSSGATAAGDYHLPLSPLGWFYGGLYLERLRPVLRAAYYRMPPALLRLLKPIIGH